jgi:glycosyltransferase involved in cell wall biosynthesis
MTRKRSHTPRRMTMQPIRQICFLTTSYPRWVNDHRGTFIRAAALAMQRRGLTVRVVTVHMPGTRLRETMDGMDVWRIPYALPFGLEKCQLPEGGLPEFWKTARLARILVIPMFAGLCLGAILGARGCQVIHAQWTLAALACRFTAWLHRKPYITTVHGSDVYQAASGRMRKSLSQSALRGSRMTIAVSRSLADNVKALGIPPKRITVISNGIDKNFFFRAPGFRDPLLVYCGSLIRRKGVDVILDAMPAIRKQHANIRLVVIGDGPEGARLQRQAEQMSLGRIVQFAGNQPQSIVGDWMRKATLFVLPSREEGQGVAALEAIACGTPCVASWVGGISEYLSEDMGKLVPPDDPAALANAIESVLDQPKELESMRRQCELFAQTHLDWDRIAEQILAVYHQAAG